MIAASGLATDECQGAWYIRSLEWTSAFRTCLVYLGAIELAWPVPATVKR
ncbi:hypothetical protein [Sideroxydans sp. CL21]|nr:hypothetical protein [Sideroxydans sp. CL21]